MDDFTPPTMSSQVNVTHKFDGSILPPSRDDINTMYWNINRINGKLDLIELAIASYPSILHVATIGETFLNKDNHSSFQIKGYQAFHNFRCDMGGGGISIFIHESICSDRMRTSVNIVSSEFHHFLAITLPSLNFDIAIAYNRPLGDTNSFLNDLQTLYLNNPNTMVMGDFIV